MYDQSSLLIAALLLVSMLLAIEAGYRIGRRPRQLRESVQSHINAMQASLLGLLALLIGFTFSLSLQRFDNRSAAVVDEANAIGTVYLRAQLLPTSMRAESLELVRKYLDQRIQAGTITSVNEAERNPLLAESTRTLDQLWGLALQAAEQDGRPVTSGLFIQALNNLFDSYTTRIAALDRHVPELVLFLLYGTFLLTGGVIGYATGTSGHRAPFATYILVALMVVVVFVIIDLDRPRRGLIQVSQQSLIELQATIRAAQDPSE